MNLVYILLSTFISVQIKIDSFIRAGCDTAFIFKWCTANLNIKQSNLTLPEILSSFIFSVIRCHLVSSFISDIIESTLPYWKVVNIIKNYMKRLYLNLEFSR